MKRIKVIGSVKDFEELVNRHDIEVLQTDIKACEPSQSFQDCFMSVVYYRELDPCEIYPYDRIKNEGIKPIKTPQDVIDKVTKYGATCKHGNPFGIVCDECNTERFIEDCKLFPDTWITSRELDFMQYADNDSKMYVGDVFITDENEHNGQYRICKHEDMIYLRYDQFNNKSPCYLNIKRLLGFEYREYCKKPKKPKLIKRSPLAIAQSINDTLKENRK